VLDIMISHNISYCEVYKSVWVVVDAINKHPQFGLRYPSSHEEQQGIAREFRKRSKAGFTNCAGCLDGMLLWMEKPSAADCASVGVDCRKFWCGRKHQ
jgi:hypothetical protein